MSKRHECVRHDDFAVHSTRFICTRCMASGRSGPLAACARADMGEYLRKIKGLAELSSSEKLLGASSGLISRVQANAHLSRSQANAELSNRLSAANRVKEVLRERLMSFVEGDGDAKDESAGRERNSNLPADAAAAVTAVSMSAVMPAAAHGEGGAGVEAASVGVALESERVETERIVSDSAEMLGELHKKVLRQRDVVVDDLRVLDHTDHILDANNAAMADTNDKLTQQVKKMQVWPARIHFFSRFSGQLTNI